jgi:hypothetical protein
MGLLLCAQVELQTLGWGQLLPWRHLRAAASQHDGIQLILSICHLQHTQIIIGYTCSYEAQELKPASN